MAIAGTGAEQIRADPQLAEYRQVRESLAESPQKELLLARWCQEKKLADEARFHWLNVLRVQPDNPEALVRSECSGTKVCS